MWAAPCMHTLFFPRIYPRTSTPRGPAGGRGEALAAPPAAATRRPPALVGSPAPRFTTRISARAGLTNAFVLSLTPGRGANPIRSSSWGPPGRRVPNIKTQHRTQRHLSAPPNAALRMRRGAEHFLWRHLQLNLVRRGASRGSRCRRARGCHAPRTQQSSAPLPALCRPHGRGARLVASSARQLLVVLLCTARPAHSSLCGRLAAGPMSLASTPAGVQGPAGHTPPLSAVFATQECLARGSAPERRFAAALPPSRLRPPLPAAAPGSLAVPAPLAFLAPAGWRQRRAAPAAPPGACFVPGAIASAVYNTLLAEPQHLNGTPAPGQHFRASADRAVCLPRLCHATDRLPPREALCVPLFAAPRACGRQPNLPWRPGPRPPAAACPMASPPPDRGRGPRVAFGGAWRPQSPARCPAARARPSLPPAFRALAFARAAWLSACGPPFFRFACVLRIRVSLEGNPFAAARMAHCFVRAVRKPPGSPNWGVAPRRAARSHAASCTLQPLAPRLCRP
ncbi:MAG: hypothetical protein J3K34DRAFT_409985 [Monoraphidium minutum]|nr:MAG: hypothetical protein J3K34DRAFT_409985 [Monoraphidium minutum]